MNAHQIEYLTNVGYLLPDGEEAEIIKQIEASFDENADLRHHTFVTLANMGYYDLAADTKEIPLYQISFDEPHVVELTTEWHSPDRYLSGGSELEDVVRDMASDIVDGGWVDNGIGHYEYGGCPGYHSQIDYEYEIRSVDVEWFEHFPELLTDEELTERLAEIMEEGASVSIQDGDGSVGLSVSDLKVTSITPVTKTYNGKVDGEWKVIESRKLYRYWFSATVGE